MYPNTESGYGKGKINNNPGFTTGRIFMVSAANGANTPEIMAMFPTDQQGIQRVWTTFTLALAQCVTGKGDTILIAPDYTVGITAAELLAAETKGVTVIEASGEQVRPGLNRTYRQTATLPQTTTTPIFTVTGRVLIREIIGQVTTVVQAQADATKLTAVPTVGSATDICATGDINAAAVGTQLFITGTLATALQISAGGAQALQATGVVVQAGTINLNCAASNTGAVKWLVDYEAIDPGAMIIAA